jgi:hypothetical protein
MAFLWLGWPKVEGVREWHQSDLKDVTCNVTYTSSYVQKFKIASNGTWVFAFGPFEFW